MNTRQSMDLFGAVALTAFALHLAFNQVVIKVTTGGFDPIFAAGLRSALAVVVLLLWIRLRGMAYTLPRHTWLPAVLSGVLFAVEFYCLFGALDMTSVSRASIIFYSMPVWLALGAHLLLPDDKLTGLRVLGLILAVAGVVVALWDRSGGAVSWQGDLMALIAAMCWAGIALLVKGTSLSTAPPAGQLLAQLVVSAPILLVLAWGGGDWLRDPQLIHWAGMAFQVVLVASLGFLVWFWLLTLYPASSVASFSFLSPVFAVILGWVLLNEEIALSIWAALALVAAGIFLINRVPKG